MDLGYDRCLRLVVISIYIVYLYDKVRRCTNGNNDESIAYIDARISLTNHSGVPPYRIAILVTS